MFKIISLFALILSLVACGSSTNESAPAKKDASIKGTGAPLDALNKAKKVQGVVDNTTKETDKTAEEGTK